jgi:hypothetical protein
MQYIWESTVMVKKVTLKILTDLHVLSLREYRKVVFGMPSVCMYVHLTSAFNGSMDFIHIQYSGVCPSLDSAQRIWIFQLQK